jgi:rhodanese-related sulfurtransferase
MKTLTKEQLKEMIDKKEDFVLVNVLSSEYFEQQHIPTSVNISIGDEDFENKIKEKIKDKNKKIVVYCASFECQASPKAAEKLTKMGYKNVFDYEGGIKDYCSSNTCASSAKAE